MVSKVLALGVSYMSVVHKGVTPFLEHAFAKQSRKFLHGTELGNDAAASATAAAAVAYHKAGGGVHAHAQDEGQQQQQV